MLILKLTVFALLHVHGVLGRNTQRENVRPRLADQEYTSSVNHPPEPEIHQGISVSVVYEDEGTRADKSIKSDILTTNSFKELNKDPIKIDLSFSKELVDTNTSNHENINVSPSKEVSGISNLDDKSLNKTKPISTTSTLKQDQQIPVAVVYEPEPSYYGNKRPNNNTVSTKRRKVHRPPVEEKQIAAKDASDVTEKEYTHETPATNKQRQSSSDSEHIQQQSFRTNDPPVKENLKEKKPLKTTATENNHKQHLSIADKQQQTESTPRSSFTTPSVEKKQLTKVKETLGTSQSGSSQTQTFPKRDNSTREREFVPIIQSENIVFSHTGDFHYSYEGGDGTKAFEKGQLKTYEDNNTGEAVSGGFSYTAKDGNEYSLSYTADENGYRPVGAHLPTPPPIPPAIARALAYLATKTTPEPVTESLTE